jgi:hypothetical protein
MTRGPLARFLTATLIAALLVTGIALSFQFELGRPLLIFAGGICVLDALARSLERYRRVVLASDLVTWALAGMLSMVVGMAWEHVTQVFRETVAVVICLLLFWGYKNVAMVFRKRLDDPDSPFQD